jgi:hypothetical protein
VDGVEGGCDSFETLLDGVVKSVVAGVGVRVRARLVVEFEVGEERFRHC